MGTVGKRGEGAAERIGGKIEKGIGKVVGSERLESEGRAKELKGEAKEEAAKAAARTKATIEEAEGVVKRGVGTAVGSEKLEAEGTAKQKAGEARHRANE